ncbi:heparin lyase I family protein, partial [Salegentibacter salegens]
MKHFFIILLFSTSAFSQNYHYALGERQSQPSPPEPPKERNINNLLLVEIFEDKNLDVDPDSGDFFSEFTMNHSFSLNINIKRFGNSAARFELKNSDPEIWGGFRAEMTQIQTSTLDEGWYGFSQYFPDSYISDATEEVVGQWHDQPD